MTFLTTPLGILGQLALLFMVYMLADLSRRLGAVTKMRPYYRGFYVAMGILLVPVLVRMARTDGADANLAGNAALYVVVYHLPFAIAITLCVVVAWRYWGWLFQESQP